jgi:phospholipid-translocating ATPase
MEFRKCSIGGQVYGIMAPTSNGRLTRSASGILSGVEDAAKKFSELENAMLGFLQDLIPYDYVPPSKFSFVDPQLFEHIRQDPIRREQILNFFLLLTVCHTVLIDRREEEMGALDEIDEWKSSHNFRPHNLLFKAQSPDEAALVAAARDLGFVFLGRDKDFIFVSVLGTIETIRVLQVLEFNSDRKRMSTIVRRQDGSLHLLCKGADNIIFERLAQDSIDSDESRATQSHLEYFAEDGLRTLCLAHKALDETEYFHWLAKYNDASAAMHNRDLLVDAIADEIERDMQLIGATAIEDRLQDGVPECIETLQLAGIKIWVLTGDKMETAINIGFSCRLLTKAMVLLVIRGANLEETAKQLRTAYEKIWSRYFCFGEHSGEWALEKGSNSSFAMIIEGGTLKHALDKSCRKLFVNLSSRCTAVICCRVSPLQKAKVVELVRRGKNVMTMAIGDGANDVSMIQAADVGVGIAGQEGMQAVMSSDYAIAQFRYLTRLLLVHGRWSYLRVAQVTLCSLYKNLAFVVLLFWYQFYCGFTAQYIYDYMYLLFFNVFFSILPLLILGSFDRDLSDATLVKAAPIYRLGIRQTSYSMKLFLVYLFDALYQSVVCFFVPLLAYRDTAVAFSGQPENQTLLGNAMALSIITCTNLYMALMMYSWVVAMFLGLSLTILTVVGFLVVYSLLPGQMLYGSWSSFMDPIFWLTIVLCIIIALAPRYLYMYGRSAIRPSDLDIVREVEKWHIGEADLAKSVNALRKDQSAPQRLSHTVNDIITLPPRVLFRTTPRRLLGLELPDDVHPTGAVTSFEPPPEPKSKGRFFRRSLALFNLRTERFEKMRGFAFSQEDGMGEVVTRKRDRPQAFGSVFLQAPDGSLRKSRLSRLPIDLAGPTMPSAVAQRGNNSQTRLYHTRRPSKLGSNAASP